MNSTFKNSFFALIFFQFCTEFVPDEKNQVAANSFKQPK
jgi:hypothetical protein